LLQLNDNVHSLKHILLQIPVFFGTWMLKSTRRCANRVSPQCVYIHPKNAEKDLEILEYNL